MWYNVCVENCARTQFSFLFLGRSPRLPSVENARVRATGRGKPRPYEERTAAVHAAVLTLTMAGSKGKPRFLAPKKHPERRRRASLGMTAWGTGAL